MNFNIGDKVKYTKNGSYLSGEEGVVSGIQYDIRLGLECRVDFPRIGVVDCSYSYLKLIKELPIGNQSLLNKSAECDCGGLKVYGSTNPMMHSTWCSSIK